MTSDLVLNVALAILRESGYQIGDAYIPPPQEGFAMGVWIDGVPCTFQEVIRMAEEESKEL